MNFKLRHYRFTNAFALVGGGRVHSRYRDDFAQIKVATVRVQVFLEVLVPKG